MYFWAWNGSWGWAAMFGVFFALAVCILPWVFFLLNLRGLLERVHARNRGMPRDYVWLNLIPIFNLGWFIYTVAKIRDSARDEYVSRGWRVEGDFGYTIGLTAGILMICSTVLGWVPVLGFGLSIAFLVCWIIYWLRTNEIKNRLGERAEWMDTTPGDRPGTPSPGSPSASPPGPAEQAVPGPAMEARHCGACGSTILDGDRFCQTCGIPLPRTSQSGSNVDSVPGGKG